MLKTCHVTTIISLITDTVIPSPSPPVLQESAGFPVAVLAVIPVIIFLIIVMIVVIILVQWRWKKRRSGKAKVVPAGEDDNNELATKKSIFDGEDGIRLTRAESFKILSKKGSFETFDDGEEGAIQITRAKSLTVIVPPGQYVCMHVLLYSQYNTCTIQLSLPHVGIFEEANFRPKSFVLLFFISKCTSRVSSRKTI